MSVRRRECPVCHRMICANGGAWRSHALTHTGAQHPNTGNPYGRSGVGVHKVRRSTTSRFAPKPRHF